MGTSNDGLRLRRIENCRDVVVCSLTKLSRPSVEGPENLESEPHKFFDQVVIVVRSGDGGNGAVLQVPKPVVPNKELGRRQKEKKRGGSYRRASDGSLILPMGGHGGDVVLVADESADSLLPLHRKKRHNAKRGANVDTMGCLSPSLHDGISAPRLSIPVPVGTVVKRKRGGKLLGDLACHGDEILVARGGRGGISTIEIPKHNKTHLRPVDVANFSDADTKVLTIGTPGEEIALELTLRVVADVGLVGFPNAGKSSLLAAVTLAKPDIADYPFTTLMPNLGCIEGDPETSDGGFTSGPTLADLPGLIKDAHLGKGLGRMFLRHLRRTRLMVHVVDASAPDPVQDYIVLREELHLYNPDYVKRPHIVVLNKLDLPEAKEKFEAIQKTIQNMGSDPDKLVEATIGDEVSSDVNSEAYRVSRASREEVDSARTSSDNRQRNVEDFRRPVAVLGISALQGEGMEGLLAQIRSTLRKEQLGTERKINSQSQQQKDRRKVLVTPQWQL